MNKLIKSPANTPKKVFLQFLVPTIIAVMLKAGLISIDMVFIGQFVGQQGLAAVGLTMPISALFTAIGIFFGVGGAALMSIQFGQQKFDEGKVIFGQSLIFSLLLTIFIATCVFLFSDPLVDTLGASEELLPVASGYLALMSFFFILHSIVIILTFFVINDGNPRLPMYSMLFGLVTCLIADYLFIIVFDLGVKGAAYGSIFTQITMIIVLITHFASKAGVLELSFSKLSFNYIPEIIKVGSPSLFIELASIFSVAIFNYILVTYYSESHLAAFSIISNLTLVVVILFSGISQASQPIFSYSFGSQNQQFIREILKLSIGVAVSLGLLILIIGSFYSAMLTSLYISDSDKLFNLTNTAIKYFIFAVPFIGLNFIMSSFLQAVKASGHASIISILRGGVLILIGLVLLPYLYPDNGIWAVTLFAEMLTFFISLYFTTQFLKKLNNYTAVSNAELG